jgi:toxin-antitoxin system PIN domain toxin
MSRIALLDINVLVALFYDEHAQHQVAHDWFAEHRRRGWATCAATENGAVRILSNPKVVDEPWTVREAIERLRLFRGSGHHHFWTNTISLTDQDVFDASAIRGHKQVNDVYLLGLARVESGSLVTFDRSIPLRAVKGATSANLVVISAGPEEATPEDT